MHTDRKLFLTTEEVARIFRVHPRTVRTLVTEGKVQAIRLGRHYRYPIEQFSDMVDVDDLKARVALAAQQSEVDAL